MPAKKALLKVILWVGTAMVFNAGVYLFMGKEKALEFLGGYIIEQSLSMDNLFLFLVIFNYFNLSARYQKKVLNYGIIGAAVLRLVFIIVGVSVVGKFHWMLYAFGLILVLSGVKVLCESDNKRRNNFKNSLPVKLLEKILPISHNFAGERFFVMKKGVLHATPLLAVLMLVEASDVMFALDSIPAIFAISTDAFIVYSSNIFAILSMRSLYFVLRKINSLFRYVKYGVGCILVFTGTKLTMLFFHVEISTAHSLLIIFMILAISVLASVVTPRGRTAV